MPGPTKILPLVLLLACGDVSLLRAAQPPIELPAPPSSPASPETLEARLMGSWLLEQSVTPGTPSGIGTRRRIFTPGKWEIIQNDPKTGEVIFHHGGTYRLNGDLLEQTVTFAGARTKNYIGRVSKFRITVDGNTYTQIAIGNQFSEVWKRMNDA